MHSIRPLEDLIIAVFFSECQIVKTPNGKELKFNLGERKIPLFHSYVHRNGIENHIRFNSDTECHIKQSVLLERIIQEWTTDGVVTAIDPRIVKTSTFLLWISLFARKTKKGVSIETSLPEWIQNDLPYYFRSYFNTNLYLKGSSFDIKPFHYILTRSITAQRPANEILELNFLLPENEKIVFKKIMAEREAEISINGYQS